jgi:hypothetical protein
MGRRSRARHTRAASDLQNKDTGAGYVSPKGAGKRATIRARRGAGVRVVLMLVETFGGIGPALLEE